MISPLEITSFAAAGLGSSDLVIASSEDPRRLAELAWHLNRLRARHGLTLLAGESQRDDLRLLKATLRALDGGHWQLDVGHLREVIGRQPSSAVWDLELYGNGRLFVTRWEDVPDHERAESLEFDGSLLPDWLTEEIPRS